MTGSHFRGRGKVGSNNSNNLKHALMRHLPLPALRLALSAVETHHNVVMRRIRKKLGLRPAGFEPAGVRRTDTVFLLGSGSSVNAITGPRWKGIAARDSIGLNFWIRHPFVPTMYFFEAAAPPVFDRLNRLIWQRQEDYQRVVKIVTSVSTISPHLERQFSALPDSWRQEIWPLEGTDMFARDERELRQEILRLEDAGLFAAGDTVTRLFKYMGTITSMISLAVRMEYRNIVLCGVDLSDSGYFHQDEKLFPDMTGFASSARTRRHALMADERPQCGADQVIVALRDLILAPRGISLFVENASSALHPAIERAPDHLFTSTES
jgi:hypothetical protein